MRLIKKVSASIVLNNVLYPVEILYKTQKRNITFRYKSDKKMFIISSPKGIPYQDLVKKLYKYSDTLIKKTKSINDLICKDYVYILGQKIILNDDHIIKFKSGDVIKYKDIDDLKKKLNIKFYNFALYYFNYYKNVMNIKDDLILKTKYLKTRFGSFSKKTMTVSLNTILYHYDKSYLEAVIVHELAHFYQLNHSKKFYDIVYKYYPNYRLIHNKLKKGVIDGNN